jgi:hypothetical protein
MYIISAFMIFFIKVYALGSQSSVLEVICLWASLKLFVNVRFRPNNLNNRGQASANNAKTSVI